MGMAISYHVHAAAIDNTPGITGKVLTKVCYTVAWPLLPFGSQRLRDVRVSRRRKEMQLIRCKN